MSRWLHLIPFFLLMNSCGSSEASDTTNSSLNSAGHTSAQAALPEMPFTVGVNASTINWWDRNRPFLNLIYGTSWQMHNPAGGNEDVPFTSLDADGWVKSVPPGYSVVRGLSVPLAGGDFACHFQGAGTISIHGANVSNVSMMQGLIRFTLKATYPNPQSALLSYTLDPTNYIHNIDCRETNSVPGASLAPEFIAALSGFTVIRFVNWQTATSENTPVSWADRNKPGGGDYLKRDGVPVELMVEAANKVGADPWFTIPWNADDDYVDRFAAYVRDNLAPGRKVYVEVSNEVWNGGYPVSTQACNEAKSEGLPGVNGGTGCSLERYAEKTKQVMQIWSTVFAGQTNRLVRVASFNHVATYWSDAILGYENLYQSVDALATAPYFAHDITDSLGFDQIMAALPGKVDDTIALGVQQKAIARKYGLRYITYEGGQHIVLPNNVPLLEQIERDTRMYDVYKRFLTGWRDQIGDDLNLYVLVGGISQYGAWGLSEYPGQPLADSPKLHAVHDVLGITNHGPPVIVTSLQICADGSVTGIGVTCATGKVASSVGSRLK